MKISYNWLKSYIKTNLPINEVCTILTDTGLEVESFEKIETVKGGLAGVTIGHVLSKTKHPDADRLNVTSVDIGEAEPLQIVCGAPNVESGQKVLVATVGSTIYPSPEEPLKIKKSKIRGVESFGMICAEDELGLGQSHEGILVLPSAVKIGMSAREYFKIEEDYLIEIGLTPNRSDAMGHLGVARDLKAYLNYHNKTNIQLDLPSTEITEVGNEGISVSIKDTLGAPRYAGAVVKNVTIQDSPKWLQNKLLSIGLKPINNIVDITNFVMHETGNPLHAFDLNKVNGTIIVRRAQKGEKLVTLDEIERKLSEEDLLICNESEPMCLAGVFGGLHSGVQINTKGIFLESAYFDPVSVRKTAKSQGLNTDSSYRFERGVDPNMVPFALKRAVHLILDLAGGELDQLVDNYPNKIANKEIQFSFERCRKLCGSHISDEDIVSILKELDIHIVSDSTESVVLNIPAYRADVTREADVIEEVLRIFGFNNIELPKKLNTSLSFQTKPNKDKIVNTVGNLLADNGFNEIMNNSLSSSSIWEKVKLTTYSSEDDVKLLNPLSNELDVMRQTLIFGGLKSIEYNQNRQHPNLRFFEFGKVYQKKENLYQEATKLGLWMTGQKEIENWANSSQKTTFYNLKAAVELILAKLGLLNKTRINENVNEVFEDGYTLTIGNKNLVEFGWIKPAILKAFGVKDSVYYADFNWDSIIELSIQNKIVFEPIPKTQFVRRDFSLLLAKNVLFSEIVTIAKKTDKKILKEVGLFDVYEGKNLDKNKKSYAVNFIFQDNENTLKDKQIDAIMDKIRIQLTKQLGAELR